MKQSLTFLLLLLLASCADTKREINYSQKITQHFTQWNDPAYKLPDTTVTSQVQQLVQTLAKDTIVPTIRFEPAYNQLKATATPNELILLTTHSNPVIRCHAYSALIQRQYSAIHGICFAHFSDTIQKVNLRVHGGVYPLSVRTWMVYELRPNGPSKYSFEPKLYRRYIHEYNDYKWQAKGK